MIDADIALGGQSLEGVFNVSEFFGCIKFFSSQYNNSPEIKKKKWTNSPTTEKNPGKLKK